MQDASKPIWIREASNEEQRQITIFCATPVHSEVSIHFAQSLLEFQMACMKRGIAVSFSLLKSSLVTQGRNLCVSDFMTACEVKRAPYTHFLFIDSDIEFKPDTIFNMIKADKDVTAVPYPMKQIDWGKLSHKIKKFNITDPKEISRAGFTWPVKLEGQDTITVKEGIAEVTHAPTGCMLIKKEVFHKMIEAYPDLKIVQPTIINGKAVEREYFYNFFDTYHDPASKLYYGEDFGFCKRWTEIGGKCHILVDEMIAHVGEYRYEGHFGEDVCRVKIVDGKEKIQ